MGSEDGCAGDVSIQARDETVSTRKTVARWLVVFVGLLLCFVGVLHDVVNIRAVQRAVARGEIAERMGRQVIANVAFGGATISVLGLILLISARDLGTGSRAAWRTSLLVGAFLVVGGVAGYLWQPIPQVLLFSVLGGLVSIPLLIWRKDFTSS